MKHCKISHKCPYGNAYIAGTCAYYEEMTDNDNCPMFYEQCEITLMKEEPANAE